jgi:glucose/arabinose dehydrogenase
MTTRRLFAVLLVFATLLAACAPAAPRQEPVAPAPTVRTAVPATRTPFAEQTAPTAAATLPPEETRVPGAQSLPDPQNFIWREIPGWLEKPTDITSPGDGSGRVFVLEQPGRIRIIQNGELLTTPFLDIVDIVGSNASEQGLLGLAFHPDYPENGFFFVNYTDRDGNTRIARFSVSASDSNLADASSRLELIRIEQPYGNHNGGSLVFGPDGYLYAGLGDGGSAGDPLDAGQSLNTLLGKILRFDVDGDQPYAIPTDNPFAAGGGDPEIWAYGLRNPWKIAFDRATGDLYIADVGQNQWEEINFTPAGTPGGQNYGWRFMEASYDYSGGLYDRAALVLPVAEYTRNDGCSVTGGQVYRGEALPEWQGVYLYGDFCSGNIWGLLKTEDGFVNSLLFKTNFRISTFGLDDDGEIYLADYGGTIYQLTEK